MQKYTDVVTSARSGAAIPSARVTVKTHPAGATATIYSDDGSTEKDNPLTTDSNGEFSFYAADGDYTLTVSGTGITERTVGPITLLDPNDEDADTLPSTDVSYTPSGSGAIAEDVQTVLRYTVHSVKGYGAVGDGATDDSTAILAAVNAAAAASSSAGENRHSVYFPPGVYLIGTSACLTPSGVTSIKGVHFCGAGMYASVLRLDPDATDIYFYNNGSTARTQFCTFADLAFEGMDPADFSAYTDIDDNAKGFRIYSASAAGSHEQGFRFFRCRFDVLGTGFEFAGDATASEFKFFGCKVRKIKNAWYSLANGQSVNHEYFGTDIEQTYGDVFSISGDGGGAIKMYGGSVIMFSDKASDVYFLKITGTGGTNLLPITFNGVRFEFRGNTTNAVSIATEKTWFARFTDCALVTTATSDLAAFCDIGEQAAVEFEGCTFRESSTGEFKFTINSSGRSGESGTISFVRCALPVDWSDRCTLDARWGHIYAIDCHGTNIGTVSGEPNHWAHDFDLHWDAATAGQVDDWTSGVSDTTLKDGGSPTNLAMRLKTAQIKLNHEVWPDNATGDSTLRLPKNAIIKNIYMRKPPHASETTSVTLIVSNSDKSTPHLSVTAQWNQSHNDETTDYFYNVGAADNERNLRLYTAENPTATLRGGLCFVEYY